MKGLAALVAGAVLSSSSYAAEPSLHTTPDPGVPLVQENADKALKVAYMVMAMACPDIDSEYSKSTRETINVKQPPRWREFLNHGFSALSIDGQITVISVTDIDEKRVEEGEVPFLLKGIQDSLYISIYPPHLKQVQKLAWKHSQAKHLYDRGLDGHENVDQQYYLSTLDKIITTCEGTKQ